MPVERTTLPGINPGLNIGPRVTNRDLGDPGGTVVLTVEQILGGLVSLTPTTATTLQFPTAAEFVENYLTSNVIPSDSIPLIIRNFGAAGVDLTVTVPAGNTISGSGVVAGGNFRQYCARMNTVGAAAAYTLFDKGSAGSDATLQGPSPVTDNAVLVYDGTSGDLVKETETADPLVALTEGTNNVALGTGTVLAARTDGTNLTIIGNDAAPLLTSGSSSVVIGNGAAATTTTGSGNVVVGSGADVFFGLDTGAIAIGQNAVAGQGAISIGQNAIADANSSQILIGTSAAGGTGCISIGQNCGSAGASSSIAIGTNALDQTTAGKTQNIAIGINALNALTTGDDNVHIGHNVGSAATTASDTVLIGSEAALAAVGSLRAIGIGAGAAGVSAPDTDEIYLDGDPAHGNTQSLFVPRLRVAVANALNIVTATGEIVDAVSSRRYKENIEPLPDMGAVVDQLRPVEFDYKGGGQHSLGLIAEEVHELCPDLVPLDAEGLPHNVHYHLLSVLLLQEVQKLKQEVAALKSQ